MGHTNSTPNLHLPQFVGSDKPTWLSDVNGAMLAIDTAYGTIEADASSAATAAAGAVTVAGAAQTAADAAATAAATAGTNASQALSTANNAASTANNAYNEAHEALGRVNGEVIASVTADGVKTIAQILEELVTAPRIAQLSNNAMIVYEASAKQIFRLVDSASGYAYFSHVSITGSSHLAAKSLRCNPGGSSFAQKAVQVTTTETTETDESAVIPPNGTTYTLYK